MPSTNISYAAEYYAKNKEQIVQRRHKYKLANPVKYLLWGARARAKNNNIEFSVTEHDIAIPKNCPVLGIPLFIGGWQNPNSPSLDRIDNQKDYVKGNVQVISFRANDLKNDATIEELKSLAKWTVGQYGT